MNTGRRLTLTSPRPAGLHSRGASSSVVIKGLPRSISLAAGIPRPYGSCKNLNAIYPHGVGGARQGMVRRAGNRPSHLLPLGSRSLRPSRLVGQRLSEEQHKQGQDQEHNAEDRSDPEASSPSHPTPPSILVCVLLSVKRTVKNGHFVAVQAGSARQKSTLNRYLKST